MKLTQAQLGTVLAALRFWQQDIEENDGDYPGELWDIAANGGTVEPLNAEQIDALCESLNCGDTDEEEVKESLPRCEGYRRYGGAFTLGPVRWEQCHETATHIITCAQDGKVSKDLPACDHCLEESKSHKVKILSITPLVSPAELRHQAIIELARNMDCISEGSVEIDSEATLSEGDDNGCYVSAWVWVNFSGTEFDKEVADED